MNNPKIAPLLFIAFAVVSRLLPHPDNFAPITAIALFAGTYLPRRYAFIIPISGLLISDYFIGFYGLTMVFVYGSFAISGLIGLWLRSRKRIETVLGASLLSSVIFYLITNFGVWLLPNSSYTKDIWGLMESYYLAVPFFRNTFLGDLFYVGVLFGGYELLYILSRRYLPRKAILQLF